MALLPSIALKNRVKSCFNIATGFLKNLAVRKGFLAISHTRVHLHPGGAVVVTPQTKAPWINNNRSIALASAQTEAGPGSVVNMIGMACLGVFKW